MLTAFEEDGGDSEDRGYSFNQERSQRKAASAMGDGVNAGEGKINQGWVLREE
jgi:hypothetical protein